MKNLVSRIWRAGPRGVARVMFRPATRAYHRLRTRHAKDYRSPSSCELEEIERRLQQLGVGCRDLLVDPAQFSEFIEQAGFPADYHGGTAGGVYREKMLEHYLAWHLLSLADSQRSPYVDVAACSSPWATLLRDKGIEAYAIDLTIPSQYSKYTYYRQEDATRTSFPDASVGAISLQCAYEMFLGSHDIDLLRELARVLKPGGKAVMSPLYTHTHACYYQTPEYFGQPWGDADATRYVRRDTWGVRASRKYSPETLKSRVLDNARQFGLEPSVHILRNASELGPDIYLHFVLVLEKPILLVEHPNEPPQ